MQQQPSRSFTATANGIAADLRTECGFYAAFDPATLQPGEAEPYLPFIAVWDSGASGSVISQRIIDACSLKPVGMTQTHGVGGLHTTEQFLVNIRLPNGVAFQNVTVIRGELQGFDALIGMNIITQGDLAITNHGGHTVFSFRVPSCECIDFVKEHRVSTPWGVRKVEHGSGKQNKRKRR